jgi:hypothetical protein
MTDRKTPSVTFWASVVVVAVLIGYPLSFGPACWWLSKPPMLLNDLSFHGPLEYPIDNDDDLDFGVRAPRVYWPMLWIAHRAPQSVRSTVHWYATAGRPTEDLWFEADPDENLWLRF